jgi:hypothetical protein
MIRMRASRTCGSTSTLAPNFTVGAADAGADAGSPWPRKPISRKSRTAVAISTDRTIATTSGRIGRSAGRVMKQACYLS